MRYNYKKKPLKADSGILKIFISYNTDDIEKIRPIVDNLSTIQDTNIFFADKTINPGENISQVIIDNIKNSDIFLVFFSKSAVNSNYVQQEIGVAKSNNKIIIPILLDSTNPTGMLVGVNYLNFYDPSKQLTELNRLYKFIIQNVESMKKGQMLKTLGLLAIGYLLLRSDDDEFIDEY